MRQLHPLTLILALCAAPLAHAEIYKCVDAEGRTTYTNDRNIARGCKAIQQDLPMTSVPAPPRAPAAGASSAPSQNSSSSGFPRVSPGDQRARDDTRRQVLEKELATEESSLAEAQKQLAEQESVRMGDERNYQKMLDRLQPYKDKVELHKRNIEALRRELGNLR